MVSLQKHGAAFLCGVAACVLSSAGQAALPYPSAETPKAVDRGLLREQAGERSITVTVALKLHDAAGAETLLQRINTAGDPQYHRFLTPEQFQARFAPTRAEVEKVSAGLRAYGLTVERATTTTLHVSGTPDRIERAFSVTLHTFDVPAHGASPSYSFRAPLQRPSAPEAAGGLVAAVVGLDTQPRFKPRSVRASATQRAAAQKKPSTLPDPFGFLTVADFAQQYDVGPLYAKGVTGKGRTIGIVTLANFTPSDVFTYWSSIGLSVDPNRLTIVNIDGGPGAPSDASGSLETTLDVEQSGGIAPGAKMIVYLAPNTNQAFVDAFATAIDSNQADSISVSWGEWEFFDNLENGAVTDPYSGRTVSSLQALHELFIQAAIQGQSMFCAAGDAGAYDIYGEVDPSQFSTFLSVDYPASDPIITTGGGTTLPGEQDYSVPGQSQPLVINVPTEQVWGWDYLIPLCAALGLDPVSCGIFPGGGGGGVSVEFPTPLYQFALSGVQRSQPGQAFVDETTSPPTTIFALPARFAGRNVPDISFNADPQTGYLVDYTSDSSGFAPEPFWGGTSFVGPQLNGVTALLDQDTRHRQGLLNFPLYLLGHFGQSYQGHNAPLRYVTQGDNWFYTGRKGYSPAAGLGIMDVANFAKAIGGH
ncbi:MAG TPA: S53 family peptidase [Stellaceae bacterium]|nr:S53 family peptidase [Stellaceae bacterium]